MAQSGTSLQSFLLSQALNQPIVPKGNIQAEKTIYGAFLHCLNRVLLPIKEAGNNLNQVSKKLNSGQSVPVVQVQSAIDAVEQALREVSEACQSLKQ